ncbi:E3 ubiquitin-protein ligase SH3RF2 [Periophthalmus magnuspinnatus]|uniref:E3 ubiquitin-protein ligase SH3RF2 n=1 Tax=Periophthalmus magnuspinnatus TaxID=409849 RepID=UPI00145A2BA4|nr:E3 ubiquitin-protein ligase SH3RF2 [Periophthalmus magnuspinnatus]XP_055080753.1 E3 ubiquitin-protein ligase SH3RF2 [Periophthalmus magnuspinnatus]
MLDHCVSDGIVPNRVGFMKMEDLSLMALLQCPGCLQQLDSSAKVLPCQHTFCKPCLQRQEPVQSQLLCPECQAPAHAQTAEELPTNLMLVRLLEGLQITQGPANTTLTPHYNVPSSLSQHRPEDTEGTQSDSSGSRDKYGQSEVSGRSTLPNQRRVLLNDAILNSGNSAYLADEDSDYGNLNDSRRVYSSAPSGPAALCRALCDFSPQEMNLQDSQYCLAFLKGDILTFIRRVDEHWIEAKLGAKTGICPLQFLEPNSVTAKILEAKSRKGSDSQHWSKRQAAEASSRTLLGPSQTSGPTPAVSNHRKQHTGPGSGPYPPKGEGGAVNGFSHKGHHHRSSVLPAARSRSHPSRGNSQSSRGNAHLSRTNSHRRRPDKQGSASEKRMSNEAPPTLTLTNPQMSSADGVPSSAQQLSISVCAVLYSYKPRRPEELELRGGEMVGVYGKFKEGWLRGLSLRTGKVGILPSNYITPVLRTSAKLFETKAASASSQYNSMSGRRPTAARTPAVVLALDKVNADGTTYPTGHAPSVPNGAQHAMASAGKASFHGGSQGWDTVRRIFNPHRGLNQFNQMSNTNSPSNTRHFAQVQTSGYSPALQRKKNMNILANCVRPFGWMSETLAPSAAYLKDRGFSPALEPAFQQPPSAPQSILVRPDSLKTFGEKPAKSVRFLTDEESPPIRRRTSSWSAGQVASSTQSGVSPLEVWAPSLTLGRDGPGIILKEGKAPIFRKGLDATVTDLNSNSPVLPQPSFAAVSAQFSPSRHRVTKTHLAQMDSELTLVQGELVLVHRPRPDGRLLVTQESSGHTGLFQNNILQVLERLS